MSFLSEFDSEKEKMAAEGQGLSRGCVGNHRVDT